MAGVALWGVGVSPRAHIIGAGVAGLSAAVRLVKAGIPVTLYDAAPHAGGRCRSFYDKGLDATIDNGAHLMMSGNVDIRAYLDLIGSAEEVFTLDSARFDFFDVELNQSWSVDLGAKQGVWSLLRWLFDGKRRPPNVGPWTLLREILALRRSRGQTVAQCINTHSQHFRTFWEPLCVGVLNAYPNEAAADLLWAVLEETVVLGGRHARPILTRNGLGAALVDPALRVLQDAGAEIRLGQRVRGLNFQKDRALCLNLARGAESLGDEDVVILAVPHVALSGLYDGMAPLGSHAILNVHYRLDMLLETALRGVIGSPAQWVFTRGDVASVTMSAADHWMDKDGDEIANVLWPDVVKVLGLESKTLPRYRVIKERRATFSQSPDSLALRPDMHTQYENFFLAGDWTNTGLPATLEGAIRSGRKAAEAVLKNAVS